MRDIDKRIEIVGRNARKLSKCVSTCFISMVSYMKMADL